MNQDRGWLERVPIAWNHAIEKDSLKIKSWSMSLSENRFALF